jgi:hypothetical protein
MARMISRYGAAFPQHVMPSTVCTFVAPVPYERVTFEPDVPTVERRCTYCLRPAVVMVRAGVRRRLSFCTEHDRECRWLRGSQRGSWWYLPPPFANDQRSWWHLGHYEDGLFGGEGGWYLHQYSGNVVVDLQVSKLHRARVAAERFLATYLLAGVFPSSSFVGDN